WIAAAATYAFSPQALILAASMMSHTLVAFGAALTLASTIPLVRGAARRPLPLSILAGVGLAMVVLARPLCAIACAVTLAALLSLALRRHQLRASAVATMAVPVVSAILALAAYNATITGSFTRFPQDAWFDEHTPPL